jgi:hypothetical protein
MSDTIPVRVLDSVEWRAWTGRRERGHGKDRYQASCREAVTGQGWAPVMFQGDVSMMWICPDCGQASGGNLGDEPVSGWDSPCWVRSGPPAAPSLTPSLGCPQWRTGECSGGHYWLRDGQLVPA